MSIASMTPGRPEQVRATVDAVRDLTAADRAGRLDALCGGDRALRDEVERQLAVEAYATLSAGATDGGRTRDLGATPVEGPLAAGEALGRYRLRRLLGRGGMGVVFHADDEQLQRPVAIKMVADRAAHDEASRGRFRAEAAAVARLLHPNVVQVYDWGECESGPYFVMEYVAGGSLADRLRIDKLPPAEAARLVRLVARAVHAAHQRGIVHRDLKPANVLLAPPADEPALNFTWGCPKVSDFGLALRLDADDGPAGAISGTPAYMSPEQAAGLASVGPASDVYSLGVILYELLTGTRPFDGPTVLEQVRTAAPEPPSRRAAVPPDLERVCLKCLEKEPVRRYASAAELADALDAASPRQRGRWPWPIKIAVSITISFGCLLFAAGWVAMQSLGTRATDSYSQVTKQTEPDPVPPVEPKATPPDAEALKKAESKADDIRLAAEEKARAEAEARAKAEAEARASAEAEAKRMHVKVSKPPSIPPKPAPKPSALPKPESKTPPSPKTPDTKQLPAPLPPPPPPPSPPADQAVHQIAPVHVLKGHRGPVTALAFQPRSDRLMSAEGSAPGGEQSSATIVWDVLTGSRANSFAWHYDRTRSLALSPDGRLGASLGGRRSEDLALWDPAANRIVRPLFDFAPGDLSLTFSSDGALLGGVNASEQVFVWTTRAGVNTVLRKQAKEPERERNPVTAAALRADRGLSVAASGHRDGTVRLWDTVKESDFGRISKLHPAEVTALAFAPDNKRLATVAADGSLRVTEGDRELAKAEAGPKALRCVAWSRDGTKLVTGGDDGTVRVWDAATGRELLRGVGHEGPVTCVAVAADGSVCASGGVDKAVRVWPLRAE